MANPTIDQMTFYGSTYTPTNPHRLGTRNWGTVLVVTGYDPAKHFDFYVEGEGTLIFATANKALVESQQPNQTFTVGCCVRETGFMCTPVDIPVYASHFFPI